MVQTKHKHIANEPKIYLNNKYRKPIWPFPVTIKHIRYWENRGGTQGGGGGDKMSKGTTRKKEIKINL